MYIIRILLAVSLGAGILRAQEPAAAADSAVPRSGSFAGARAFTSSRPALLFPAVRDPEWLPQSMVGRVNAASVYRGHLEVAGVHTWQLGLPVISTAAAASLPGAGAESEQTPRPRAKAVVYSNGYYTRLKLHKIASYATIPLFASQFAVGQKLYNGNRSSSLRSAHSALAVGTAVLFGINSVTGVWNLWDARRDPTGRGKRMFHGILMLGADAGFVATGALAPDDDEGRFDSGNRRSAHRTVAIFSMSVATASYLYMLFAR